MSQNTSSAVMQQRKEPDDSLDYFPTPPWATRALCEQLGGWLQLGAMSVWEPACGEGHMARPLAEYFRCVHASDVHDYSDRFPTQDRLCDFLFFGSEPPHIATKGVDWIITNPPFRLAAEFVHRGLGIARRGVAMLVRTAFLEGVERHASLFSAHRPWAVMQFVERVPMVKGRLDKSSSTATSYCWIVWRADVRVNDTAMFWIPPCRQRLERDSDYPSEPAMAEPLGGLFGGAA